MALRELFGGHKKNPATDSEQRFRQQVQAERKRREKQTRLEGELTEFATAKDATKGSPKLQAITYLYRMSVANIEVAQLEREITLHGLGIRAELALAQARDRVKRLEDEKLVEEDKPVNYIPELTQLTKIVDGLRGVYSIAEGYRDPLLKPSSAEHMVAAALKEHRTNIHTGKAQSHKEQPQTEEPVGDEWIS